ncbi:MAG: DUF6599 family protein [Pyrinomonadaceae bacterium]
MGAVVLPVGAKVGIPNNEAVKTLPDQIEGFRARGPAVVPDDGGFEARLVDFGVQARAVRVYASQSGDLFQVEVIKTINDSGAYSLLTAHRTNSQEIKLGSVGTAGFVEAARIAFFKGTNFVTVTRTGKESPNADKLIVLARSLAQGLDASEDDIPVLVRHLPYWQTSQPWARYAVSSNGLKQDVQGQPILNEVSFEGGSEAVAARYEASNLVIVEFTTPQLAGDNDRRITAKIPELRQTGQPVPSAYRRVGNYSVFVFNATDEKTAARLIDQVKYEQVVQWLGENPYWFEKAQRLYAGTTAGVLIAVLQSSGLSILICLAIGGALGGILFQQRRKSQSSTGYSDAGGMVRLNIDDMTAESDPGKLLGEASPRSVK